MRRAIVLLATIALTVVFLSLPANADEAPETFGSDWDDPRTAEKPIDKPDTESCEVKIVDHEFDDFEPATGRYEPPPRCGTDWSKVVLRLEGSVAGRQFDRLGQLSIGDVPVFKTSTPQPSSDGIEWTQEKDLTDYAPLLATERDTSMTLGNVVDGTHTGVLDVRVYLTFYTADEHHPAAATADAVLPLRDRDTDGADLTGELRTPRNAERLLADVYATGSGGGCEGFWYLSAPADTGYSCDSGGGPYREVQVLIDGELAGLAAPYPHVYTGGWSNPFLWYTLPGPRAFDIRPISYDLTPYLGMINDGESHDVTIRVEGVESDTRGWSTPTAFRVWQDEGSRIVDGALLESRTSELTNDVTHTDGELDEVRLEAGHTHSASGWLSTSHGDIMTTVERGVSNSSVHRWGAEENPDELKSTWTDSQTRTVLRGDGEATQRTTERNYGIDGRVSIDADNRLTTRIALSDTANLSVSDADGTESDRGMKNEYSGRASYQREVPRVQRHATGVSRLRYRLSGDSPCYDRTIATENGYLTRDSYRCGKAVGLKR